MTSPAQLVKNPPASVRDTGDTRSIPGLGRSPGGGNGDLLQYSYLENPMDRGYWRGYSLWGHRVGHDGETAHPCDSMQSGLKERTVKTRSPSRELGG